MQNLTKEQREEAFHDLWAQGADFEKIDVPRYNEAMTNPEMRYIIQSLGDVQDKRLLDVGCGLGETSVYFAMKGAKVTGTDLSGHMLECTKRLAEKYNVHVNTLKTNIEKIDIQEKFDIIYAGNLFHHVDIDTTIRNLKPLLKDDGVLICLDPLAYNPLINIYRIIVKNLRTPDEHPVKRSDIALFKRHFQHTKIRFFWLTTLIIFVLMMLVQFKNPNKVRFWKAVVYDADKWSLLYSVLEKIDGVLLSILPQLGLLCWNVVIIASHAVE